MITEALTLLYLLILPVLAIYLMGTGNTIASVIIAIVWAILLIDAARRGL